MCKNIVMGNLSTNMNIIYNLCGILGILSMISGLTFYPLIFNYIIVPEIERKLGQKLGYYRMNYRLASFSKFLGRYAEISFYIFVKSVAHLFGKDPNKMRVGPRTFALQKVNYPYEMFTKKEIIWSTLAIINTLLFFGCGGALILMDKYWGIH